MSEPTARYICTKDNPWTPDKGFAVHPDANDIGESSDSCFDKYHCPNCNLYFRVEVPQ
jgi:hypothetical protein